MDVTASGGSKVDAARAIFERAVTLGKAPDICIRSITIYEAMAMVRIVVAMSCRQFILKTTAIFVY